MPLAYLPIGSQTHQASPSPPYSTMPTSTARTRQILQWWPAVPRLQSSY